MSTPATVGILGTGALATFLVEGSRRAGAPWGFLLSPRNADRARTLARLPGVRVAAGNQEVVGACDLVVLALPPRGAEAALGSLRFRAEQTVLSAMAAVSPARVARLVAPARSVVAMMPGHANALGCGPSLIHPEDARARAFLAPLGPVHAVDEAATFAAASTFGAFSGMSFAFLAEAIAWFTRAGLPPEVARRLVAETIAGNARVLLESAEPLAGIAAGVATPGGITEQGLAVLRERGGLASWSAALDAVRRRIEEDGP